MFYWLADKLIDGYIYATSTFLLIFIFLKSTRQKSNSFLNLANLIILLPLAINLFGVIISAIECKKYQLKQFSEMHIEGFDFYYSPSCFRMLIAQLFFGVGIQSLFFIKRFREKVWLTIISVLFVLVLQHYEVIYATMFSLFRDSLNCYWAVQYEPTDKIWTALFSVIYFIVCWFGSFNRSKRVQVH